MVMTKARKSFAHSVAAATLFFCVPSYSINLNPIDKDEWSYEYAVHLASRAGFGGTPAEISSLSKMDSESAVGYFVDGHGAANVEAFEHSGIFDEGLDPFPASRPATTRLAKEQGHALGIKVKPGGNRPLQPIVNKFFYWLRASRLETDRLSYWWANRMLTTNHPLQEKIRVLAESEGRCRGPLGAVARKRRSAAAGAGSLRGVGALGVNGLANSVWILSQARGRCAGSFCSAGGCG